MDVEISAIGQTRKARPLRPPSAQQIAGFKVGSWASLRSGPPKCTKTDQARRSSYATSPTPIARRWSCGGDRPHAEVPFSPSSVLPSTRPVVAVAMVGALSRPTKKAPAAKPGPAGGLGWLTKPYLQAPRPAAPAMSVAGPLAKSGRSAAQVAADRGTPSRANPCASRGTTSSNSVKLTSNPRSPDGSDILAVHTRRHPCAVVRLANGDMPRPADDARHRA